MFNSCALIKRARRYDFFRSFWHFLRYYFILPAKFHIFSYFCIVTKQKMGLYIDIHTHHPTLRHIEPQGVGRHPWYAMQGVPSINEFEQAPLIGEIGLDYHYAVDPALQERVFREQLSIAQSLGRVVVLHCVKAFEPMMKILSEYQLRAAIFHGFIGSVEQANRAIKSGYYLSFGPRSLRSTKSIKALMATPLNRLFAESDESGERIEDIYSAIATIKGISVEELQNAIENNHNKIFTDNHE